jgi:multidrug transporter EmrE-like cation transporter
LKLEPDSTKLSEIIAATPILKTYLLGWGMVFLFVFLNVFGALTLKNQVQKLGNDHFENFQSACGFFFKFVSSWQTFAAIGALFFATVVWMIAITNLELSRAYPVAIGLNCVLVMVLSIFFYNEGINFFKVTGVILILSGIVCVLKG